MLDEYLVLCVLLKCTDHGVFLLGGTTWNEIVLFVHRIRFGTQRGPERSSECGRLLHRRAGAAVGRPWLSARRKLTRSVNWKGLSVAARTPQVDEPWPPSAGIEQQLEHPGLIVTSRPGLQVRALLGRPPSVGDMAAAAGEGLVLEEEFFTRPRIAGMALGEAGESCGVRESGVETTRHEPEWDQPRRRLPSGPERRHGGGKDRSRCWPDDRARRPGDRASGRGRKSPGHEVRHRACRPPGSGAESPHEAGGRPSARTAAWRTSAEDRRAGPGRGP